VSSNPEALHLDPDALAQVLVEMGCPPERVKEMARQLRNRARQLAEAKGRSEAEALAHLLGLMKQGWAAREKGH